MHAFAQVPFVRLPLWNWEGNRSIFITLGHGPPSGRYSESSNRGEQTAAIHPRPLRNHARTHTHKTTALQEKGSATEEHTQDVHEAILPFSSQQPSSESWRSRITPRPDLLESLDTDVIFCEQAVGGLLLAWGNRPKNEANIHTRASKS